MKTQSAKPTTDAVEILREMLGKTPAVEQLLEQERSNFEIAQKIYDLREKAGLSQKQLAERVGTTQSVISRLEDANYDGHSLPMLHRIAEAMEKRVEIRFVPARRKLQSA